MVRLDPEKKERLEQMRRPKRFSDGQAKKRLFGRRKNRRLEHLVGSESTVERRVGP